MHFSNITIKFIFKNLFILIIYTVGCKLTVSFYSALIAVITVTFIYANCAVTVYGRLLTVSDHWAVSMGDRCRHGHN